MGNNDISKTMRFSQPLQVYCEAIRDLKEFELQQMRAEWEQQCAEKLREVYPFLRGFTKSVKISVSIGSISEEALYELMKRVKEEGSEILLKINTKMTADISTAKKRLDVPATIPRITMSAASWDTLTNLRLEYKKIDPKHTLPRESYMLRIAIYNLFCEFGLNLEDSNEKNDVINAMFPNDEDQYEKEEYIDDRLDKLM